MTPTWYAPPPSDAYLEDGYEGARWEPEVELPGDVVDPPAPLEVNDADGLAWST